MCVFTVKAAFIALIFFNTAFTAKAVFTMRRCSVFAVITVFVAKAAFVC